MFRGALAEIQDRALNIIWGEGGGHSRNLQIVLPLLLSYRLP